MGPAGEIEQGSGEQPACGAAPVSRGQHVAEGRASGIARGRAALLLVVAIVVGLIFVHGVHPAQTTAATSTTATTAGRRQAAASTSAPSTVTTTVAPSSVVTLVANGTTVSGAAGKVSATLRSAGYDVRAAVDATQAAVSTAVYFAPGYGASAQAVAQLLGVGASAVQTMPAQPPVSSAAGVDVLVIVGPDLASRATSATSTSAPRGGG